MSNLQSPPLEQPSPVIATPTPQTRFGWIDVWLVFLMVVWGSNFAILKSVLDVVPPYVVNGVRFTVGAIVLGVLFRAQGIKLILPRREWPIIIWLAFLGQAVYQGVWLYALRRTTVANSSLIITLMPVWVVLYNAFRGSEKLNRTRLTGLLLAFGGVALVIFSRAGGIHIDMTTIAGDALTVLASMIWAATTIWSLKPVLRNPAQPVAFWSVVWGAAFQLLFAIPDLTHINMLAFDASVWLKLLYSGAISIGIGNLIWFRGIAQLGTGRPALYTYLEPLFAAIAAVLFLSEPLTLTLTIGAIMILLGVYIVKGR